MPRVLLRVMHITDQMGWTVKVKRQSSFARSFFGFWLFRDPVVVSLCSIESSCVIESSLQVTRRAFYVGRGTDEALVLPIVVVVVYLVIVVNLLPP
jgi:hypothetical protein